MPAQAKCFLLDLLLLELKRNELGAASQAAGAHRPVSGHERWRVHLRARRRESSALASSAPRTARGQGWGMRARRRQRARSSFSGRLGRCRFGRKTWGLLCAALLAVSGGRPLLPRRRLAPGERWMMRGRSPRTVSSVAFPGRERPPARAPTGSSTPLLPSEGKRPSDRTLNIVRETPRAARNGPWSHTHSHTRWEHTQSGRELKSLL